MINIQTTIKTIAIYYQIYLKLLKNKKELNFLYFKKSLQFIQEQLIIYKKYISFSSEQIKLNSTSKKKKVQLNTCPEELLSNSLLLTITAFDNLPTSETITSCSIFLSNLYVSYPETLHRAQIIILEQNIKYRTS